MVVTVMTPSFRVMERLLSIVVVAMIVSQAALATIISPQVRGMILFAVV
jgi:hypothetical protein